MIIVTMLFLLLSSIVSAQQLSFPTAEGFGRFSTGGRGDGSTGYVCHVTNSAITITGSAYSGGPHHTGTLPYCLNLSGHRTIVVDISGTIDFADTRLITAGKDNFTLAAQTAPADGVMIKETWWNIDSSHAIIRHLHFRSGIVAPEDASNWRGILVGNLNGSRHDVILDHVSMSWWGDDGFNAFHAKNVTFQWGIVSEGLRMPKTSGTTKGGGMWLGGGNGGTTLNGVSILHTLLAHHWDRGPNVNGGDLQFVNNVVYNIASGTQIYPTSSAIDIELRRNYYLQGPDSTTATGTNIKAYGFGWDSAISQSDADNTRIYLDNNFHNTLRTNDSLPQDSLVSQLADGLTIVGSNLGFPTIGSMTTATLAFSNVLDLSGAKIPSSNSIDARIITEVNTVSGTRRSSPTAYPTVSITSRDLDTYDTDRDGIPNVWEGLCTTALGLDDADKNDSNDIITGVHSDVNGYSKLEVYINELAGDYPINSCGNQLSTDTTAPSTPTMNTPTVASHTELGLSWSTATDASGISGYTILWCQDDGSETCMPSNPINSSGTGTSYPHTGRNPGTTYGYQVRAIDDSTNLNPGEYSSPVEYATTDTAPGADITTGLVSHWSFDSVLTGAGSAPVTLTFQPSGSPTYPTGRINNGIDLNGTTQYLSVADNAAHDFGTSTDFAFALWVKDDATSKQYYLSKAHAQGSSSDGGWSLEYGTVANKLFVSITADTWNDYCSIASTLDVTDGGWHHIAANVFRNTSCTIADIEIFIDGVLDQGRTVNFSSANTNADVTNNDPLFVGAENVSVSGSITSFMNGQIDDVRIYNRTLDVVDVEALVALADTDTIDPSVPTGLQAMTSNDEDEVIVNLTWAASTDNVDIPTYRIQRCTGKGCSNFSDYDTSTTPDYLDTLLSDHTWHSYKVRAEDLSANASVYTSPVEILTLDLARLPMTPSSVGTSASPTASLPSVPITVGTPNTGPPTMPPSVTDVDDIASSSPTIPSAPTGVQSP